jgi:hypothetical protein
MYAVYTRILRNTIYSTCIWYDVVSRMYYVCYSYYNPRCLHLATSLLVDVHGHGVKPRRPCVSRSRPGG